MRRELCVGLLMYRDAIDPGPLADAAADDAADVLFPALFEASPDGLLLVDGDGVIHLANQVITSMLGVGRDELVGTSIERFVPSEHRSGHHRHVERFVADPARRPMGTGLELFAEHAGGDRFPVEISLSPVDIGGRRFVLAAVRDVSERQEARAGLALMSERERIARDLHDMVIQRVFAAGMSLQALAPMIDSPVVKDRLGAVTDDLDATIRELRAAIFRLGNVDDDRTLPTQLRSVIDERSRALGFEPAVSIAAALDDVPDHVAEQLLATLTEALSNVARHARANSVRISVDHAGEELSLVVVDDGVGISGTPKAQGGLANMMWRAAELGGRCAVEANSPSGTIVDWRVPV